MVAGCGRHGTPAPSGGSDLKPGQVKLKRNVELAQARQQKLDYSVKTVGYLQAEGETNIAAGVTGVVDEVLFREGQWVPSGAILVKVDQRRYLAAVTLARANVKRAEENRELAEKLERIAKNSGAAISPEDHTKALQAVRVALAELSAAQAALDLAENNLYRSQVRAPYAGQMNQRMVTRGTYLEEKTVIGTIADLSRLRLVASVPEKAGPMVRELKNQRDAVRLASEALQAGCLVGPSAWPGFTGLMLHEVEPSLLGYEVQFTLGAFRGRTFYARVFYLSTQASPDTHMFECKGDVELGKWKKTFEGPPLTGAPGEDASVELKPGYFAEIQLPLKGKPSACFIPEESVRASEEGQIAFVPEMRINPKGEQEWRARQVRIEPGFRSPGWVEVLDGLEPGTWVVSKGTEALEPGTPLNIPERQLRELQSAHRP
jgi:RND family efflux transporter MFP subunit